MMNREEWQDHCLFVGQILGAIGAVLFGLLGVLGLAVLIGAGLIALLS